MAAQPQPGVSKKGRKKPSWLWDPAQEWDFSSLMLVVKLAESLGGAAGAALHTCAPCAWPRAGLGTRPRTREGTGVPVPGQGLGCCPRGRRGGSCAPQQWPVQGGLAGCDGVCGVGTRGAPLPPACGQSQAGVALLLPPLPSHSPRMWGWPCAPRLPGTPQAPGAAVPEPPPRAGCSLHRDAKNGRGGCSYHGADAVRGGGADSVVVRICRCIHSAVTRSKINDGR